MLLAVAFDVLHAERKRTSAWATVSLIVAPRDEVIGSRGSIAWLVPRASHPGVRRVVTEGHGASARRSGQHVQEVEVVAGRGHRRSVVAVGNQDRVAGRHFGEDVDLAIGSRAVDALVAAGTGCHRAAAPPVDLEVVDLFQHRFARTLLVVLVRWVRRPVAARGEDLDRDQSVGLERRRARRSCWPGDWRYPRRAVRPARPRRAP